MAISAAIVAILSGIAALTAVSSGGIMWGIIVFLGIFLFLSGGSITFLTGVSSNAIIILIAIIIIFKLLTKKNK